MTTAMMLDCIVIALLCAAAAGGWLISRRLARLTLVQEELRTALSSFDEAAARADIALKRLESGGVARSAELQMASKRAEALIAELSVMNSAGERIADRIDGAVNDVRKLGAARNRRAA